MEFADITFTEKYKHFLIEALKPEHRIVVAEGAIRSGKSFISVFGFVLYSFEYLPSDSMIAVVGVSQTSIAQNIDLYMKSICADIGIAVKASDIRGTIILHNGKKRLYLSYISTKDSTSWKSIQGRTFHAIYCDEFPLFNETAFDQVLMRQPGEGAKIFMCCNPMSNKHWSYKRFIANAPEYQYREHFELDDNPGLSEETKDMYRSLYSGNLYKRYIKGEWIMADNLVYPMFDETLHVIDASDVPEEYGASLMGVDSGFTDATVAVKLHVIDDMLIAVGEYIHFYSEDDYKTPEEYAAEIVEGTDPDSRIYVDPAAKGQMLEIRKIWRSTHVAKNTVNQVYQDSPQGLLGIALIQSLLNRQKLLISTACKELIGAMYDYAWDKDAFGNIVDKPQHGDSSHILDALRYAVNSYVSGITKPIIAPAPLTDEDIIDDALENKTFDQLLESIIRKD